MKDVLDSIREAWKWAGLEPIAVVATNAFGNCIVRAVNGAYWRICLKIPGILGGEYEASNVGTISLHELLEVSGHVAQQINDLPDGTAARFRFMD